ncbi:MAG TPA: hypothetical protein VFR97_02460 [Capillimicrobium sp.]|nr:hypothetical protein [Capillimicrobium sp.]
MQRTVHRNGFKVQIRYRSRGGFVPAADPVLAVLRGPRDLRRVNPASGLGTRFCGDERDGCGALMNRRGRPQLAVGTRTHAGMPEIGVPLHSFGAHCCFFAIGLWVDPNGAGGGEPAWKAITAFSGSNVVRTVNGTTPTFEVGDWRFEYGFTAYAFSWRPRARIRLWVSPDGSRAEWRDVTPRSFLRAQLREVRRLIATSHRNGSNLGLRGTMPAKVALLLRLGRVGDARATLRSYARVFDRYRAGRVKRKLIEWGYWPGKRARPRSERLPTLSRREAARYLRSALRSRFGSDVWDASYRRRTACRQRLSRTAVRCRPFWGAGDTYFSGRARIWYRRSKGGVVHWHYAWRIREVSEYCLFVLERPRRECVQVHVVK